MSAESSHLVREKLREVEAKLEATQSELKTATADIREKSYLLNQVTSENLRLKQDMHLAVSDAGKGLLEEMGLMRYWVKLATKDSHDLMEQLTLAKEALNKVVEVLRNGETSSGILHAIDALRRLE